MIRKIFTLRAEKDPVVENDLEAENDRKAVNDLEVGNDLEVWRVLKVEIGHAVVNDQTIAENDPIPEIVQFTSQFIYTKSTTITTKVKVISNCIETDMHIILKTRIYFKIFSSYFWI